MIAFILWWSTFLKETPDFYLAVPLWGLMCFVLFLILHDHTQKFQGKFKTSLFIAICLGVTFPFLHISFSIVFILLMVELYSESVKEWKDDER